MFVYNSLDRQYQKGFQTPPNIDQGDLGVPIRYRLQSRKRMFYPKRVMLISRNGFRSTVSELRVNGTNGANSRSSLVAERLPLPRSRHSLHVDIQPFDPRRHGKAIPPRTPLLRSCQGVPYHPQITTELSDLHNPTDHMAQVVIPIVVLLFALVLDRRSSIRGRVLEHEDNCDTPSPVLHQTLRSGIHAVGPRQPQRGDPMPAQAIGLGTVEHRCQKHQRCGPNPRRSARRLQYGGVCRVPETRLGTSFFCGVLPDFQCSFEPVGCWIRSRKMRRTPLAKRRYQVEATVV